MLCLFVYVSHSCQWTLKISTTCLSHQYLIQMEILYVLLNLTFLKNLGHFICKFYLRIQL
jgi:hypothetical protein